MQQRAAGGRHGLRASLKHNVILDDIDVSDLNPPISNFPQRTITMQQDNSAFHPAGVGKSSTGLSGYG